MSQAQGWTADARASPRWQWAVALSASLLGLVILALLRGTPEDVPWYLTHLGAFGVITLLFSSPLGARVGVFLLMASAVALPLITIVVGATPVDPWGDGARVQLFTGNPNLLAADLVAVFLAATVVRPHRAWAWWLPVVAIAVVFTGSRTALSALASAAVVVLILILPTTPRRVRASIAAWVLVFGAVLAFANWQLARELRSDNLLRETMTFTAREWRTYSDAVVHIQPRATEGPFPGTKADRIRAETTSSRLTVYQSTGRSWEGTAYVASVYLRAESRQTLVLSNHLTRVTCNVASEWARCVTPPGLGDDRSAAQFRLEAVEVGGGFDVYAYGPQYQIGVEASAYQARGDGILPASAMLRWLVPVAGMQATLPRRVQFEAAFDALRTAPWLGLGRGWPTGRFDQLDRPIQHAHNFLLERLATDGVLGTAVWAALCAIIASTVWRRQGVRALPWLAALAVLNAFDHTLFHAGTYLSTGALVGLGLQR